MSVDQLQPPAAVDVRPLLRPLGDELLALLRSLGAADWERPATARWSVRDVAAHLLDTAARRLTFHRDGEAMPPPDVPIRGYGDLTAFLHRLNADWIATSARFSPRLLIDLLAVADPQEADFLAGLEPDAPAFFPVAWAAEAESRNWLDVAREYTERWHHQQQIRDAVGAPPLTAPRWLRPVMETASRCLPRAWSGVAAPAGSTVQIRLDGPTGGAWALVREVEGWRLLAGISTAAIAEVETDDETAWRLWHRMLTPEVAAGRLRTRGPAELVAPFLASVAVMA
jgi:hypothetical protein